MAALRRGEPELDENKPVRIKGDEAPCSCPDANDTRRLGGRKLSPTAETNVLDRLRRDWRFLMGFDKVLMGFNMGLGF